MEVLAAIDGRIVTGCCCGDAAGGKARTACTKRGSPRNWVTIGARRLAGKAKAPKPPSLQRTSKKMKNAAAASCVLCDSCGRRGTVSGPI